LIVKLRPVLARLPAVDAKIQLQADSVGLRWLREEVEVARRSVTRFGDLLWDMDVERLSRHFPSKEEWSPSLGITLTVYDDNLVNKLDTVIKTGYSAECSIYLAQDMETILQVLDAMDAALDEMFYRLTPEWYLGLNAKHKSLSLPSVEVEIIVHRYETAAQRQLYKAMHELERLQRQRLGDNVPPPLSLSIVN